MILIYGGIRGLLIQPYLCQHFFSPSSWCLSVDGDCHTFQIFSENIILRDSEWVRIRSFDKLLVLVLTCTCLYVVCCTICFERLYGFEYVVNMLYTFRVSICVWYKHLYIYWNVIKFINNNIKKIDSNLWWHHLRLSKKQGYYKLHLWCHLSDPW